MHRTTASLLGTAPDRRLTTQHKLTLCESALMVHFNHARASWSIHKRTAAAHATHAFLCTYLSKESVNCQAAGIAALVSPCAHRQ